MKKEDLKRLYENIYKYQILKQEEKLGDFGLPQPLPDKAQIALHQLEEYLSKSIPKELLDLIRVADEYSPTRLPSAEKLRELGKELMENLCTDALFQLVHEIYGTETIYSDFLRIQYDVDEEPQIAKELIESDEKMSQEFLNRALDEGTKPFFALDMSEFLEGQEKVSKDKIEEISAEMKSALESGDLSDMIIAFQYGLTFAHNNAPLAAKYLGTSEPQAVEFLKELSNMDVSKLNDELRKLLGYAPGSKMGMKKKAKSIEDLGAKELDAIVDVLYDMEFKDVAEPDTRYILAWLRQDPEIEDVWEYYESEEHEQEIANLPQDPEFREFVKYDPKVGLLNRLREFIYKFEQEIIQNGKVKIYRAIVVPDEWFTHFPESGKRLGKWWSWDPESAKPYQSYSQGGTTVTFMAEVDESQVDWIETLAQNLSSSFGEEGSREREVTLFKNTPIKLENVWLDDEEIDDEIFFEWFAPKTFYASNQAWSKVAMPPQMIEGAEDIIERIYELTYKYQVLNSQEYLNDRANIELLRIEPELKKKLQQGIKLIIEGAKDWRENEQVYIDSRMYSIKSHDIAKYKDELSKEVCDLMDKYLEKEDIIIYFQNEYGYTRREIEDNFFDDARFLKDSCLNFLRSNRYSVNFIEKLIEVFSKEKLIDPKEIPFINMIIESNEEYEKEVFTKELPQVKPIEEMIEQLKSVQTSNDITELVQNFNYGLTMVHHNGPLAEWILDSDAISILDSFSSQERIDQWNKELQRIIGKPVEFDAPVQEWFQPEAFKKTIKSSSFNENERYFHGRYRRKDLNTGHVILFSNSLDAAVRYAGSNGSIWELVDWSNTNILDTRNEDERKNVAKKLIDLYVKGLIPTIGMDSWIYHVIENEGIENEDVEKWADALSNDMQVPDIVDTAGFLDDPGIISGIWEIFEYDAILTEDGAAVLNIDAVDIVDITEDIKPFYELREAFKKNAKYEDLGKPISGIFYHGTAVDSIEDIFTELETGYSEWNAIWITPEENIAKHFMENMKDQDNIGVLLKVRANLDNVLDIGFSYSHIFKEIQEEVGCEDFRECIDYIQDLGFDGWEAVGGLDTTSYTDVAVFDPNKLETLEVNIFIHGKETGYMSMETLSDFLEEHLEKSGRKKKSYISNPIIQLKDYLTLSDADKGKELAFNDINDFFNVINEQYNEVGWEIARELNIDEDELNDDIMDNNLSDRVLKVLEHLDDDIFETYLEWYSQSPAVGAHSPTFLFMDFISLIKNQWLVHFTDNAHEIAKEGFTKGVEDFREIGLTTWFTEEYRSIGGYNFAYTLEDAIKYGFRNNPGEKSNYGSDAVIFRASGVKVWHRGDDEPQVIFFGETANNIIPVFRNDDSEGWYVIRKDTGEEIIEKESFESIVEWISNNYNQYKRVLGIKIDKKDLNTNVWYENEDGDKFIPKLDGEMPPDIPKNYNIQVSRFPNSLKTTYLMLIDPEEVKKCPHPKEFIHPTDGWIDGVEGRECRQCGGTQTKNVGEDWPEDWEASGHKSEISFETSWPQDLVMAMVESGDYKLEEAIVIASEACERCMNALADKYGLKWGYPEGSEEWKDCGTECDFCKVEKKTNKLKLAYNYKLGEQSIEEIIKLWVEEEKKLYDDTIEFFNIYEILPYREYEWTKEDARRYPEEWEDLKDSIRKNGWNPNSPVILQIGKNGKAKVGEGNHRLAVALELIENEGRDDLKNVPVSFIFGTTVNISEELRTPEKRNKIKKLDEERKPFNQKPKKQMTEEEQKQIDEIMELLVGF